MVTVHVDPLMIAAPYMALSGLVGLLVGLVSGYWFGRASTRARTPTWRGGSVSEPRPSGRQ